MAMTLKVAVCHVRAPKTNDLKDEDLTFFYESKNLKMTVKYNLFKPFLNSSKDAGKSSLEHKIYLDASIHSKNNENSEMIKTYKHCTLVDQENQRNNIVTFSNYFDTIAPEKIFDKNYKYIDDGKIRLIIKFVSVKTELSSARHLRLSLSTDTVKNLYDSMIFSDVKIITSDEVTLRAHRSILGTRTEVFKEMFLNDTSEKQTGVIEMKQTHSRVVKDLLRFIYCGSFFNGLRDAVGRETELYCEAEKYQLEDLKSYCLEVVYMRLDTDSALDVIKFAFGQKSGLKELLDSCLNIIFANFPSICACDKWRNLNDKYKILILELYVKKFGRLKNPSWICHN